MSSALFLGAMLCLAAVICSCRDSLPKPLDARQAEARRLKIEQASFAYHQKTLRAVYDASDNTGPAWDDEARDALDGFAELQSFHKDPDRNDLLSSRITRAVEAASRKGCKDPVIAYLKLRFFDSHASDELMIAAYDRVGPGIMNGPYGPLRKFHVLRRVFELRRELHKGEKLDGEEQGMLQSIAFLAQQSLLDPAMPAEEVRELGSTCHEVLEGYKKTFTRLLEGVMPPLLKSRGGEAPILLMHGEWMLTHAWNARGSGYSDSVEAKQWELFASRLAEAGASLEKAWSLDPHNPDIAVAMMRVELGQGKGREREELWFRRAMAVDPRNYNACWQRLSYLEPKWYGSEAEMLAFGRECLRNKAWQGRVPLILPDAHSLLAGYWKRSNREGYWLQPGVWEEVSEAYERFFRENPDDSQGYRHNYLRFAHRCRQWEVFQNQLPLMGWTNHAYFGGEAEFRQMVEDAEAGVKGRRVR